MQMTLTMNLPDDIKSRISSYLNMEFGSLDPENRIRDSDLIYLGEVDGVCYWYFPTASAHCWATVEPYESSYLIGMTTVKPDL